MPLPWHSFLHTVSLWVMLHRLISGGVCIVWYGGVVLIWKHRSHYLRMSSLIFQSHEMKALPKLSILVPACDEGRTVERAMRSLMALDYPNFEIIAVNDRSKDETGEILDCLALDNPALKVIHIDTLPNEWLGKNHALHVASRSATGEWLLFTDADVIYRRDTMQVAVAHALREKLDHLVVCPRCEAQGFWEKLFMSYFLLMFLLRVRPWEVSNVKRKAFMGFGAFNMVRAEAYRKSGGHASLPMEVADDYKLGKILKRHGYLSGMLDGSDYLSLRWVFGFQGVWNGFTKNAFASFDFSLFRTFFGMTGLVFTAIYPVFGLLVPNPPVQIVSVLTLIAMISGAFSMRRVTGANPFYGLCYPVAGTLVIGIILKSTWLTFKQRGIVWRGTKYPLDVLRKGVV